jgi:hypothetical protein
MSNDKNVVELRRAEQAAETGYSYEIVLHHAEGVNVLAKLRQDLPVEMCRRFAAEAAHYYRATLHDQTTSHHQMTALNTNVERWLKQAFSDIKMKDRKNR